MCPSPVQNTGMGLQGDGRGCSAPARPRHWALNSLSAQKLWEAAGPCRWHTDSFREGHGRGRRKMGIPVQSVFNQERKTTFEQAWALGWCNYFNILFVVQNSLW